MEEGQCAPVQTGCVMAPAPRSKPRRPGGWGWVAGAVAVVVVAVCAFWSYPLPGAPKAHTASRQGLAAGAAAPRATDFPWDSQLGAASAPSTASKPPGVQRPPSRFSMMSAAFMPPARPVWEMLRNYPGPSVAGIDADVDMLVALSYCEYSGDLPRLLWEGRSQGTASAAQLKELDTRHAQATALCARLSDSDYALRTEILRLHARAGNVDAQLHFQYVGPTGRHGPEGFAGVPQSDAQLAAWYQEVLGYAKQALVEEPLPAVSTLAWLYDAGPSVPPAPAYAVHDPAEGHAYRILLARMVRNPHAMADFMQREVARLPPDQVARGQARAEAIAQGLAAQLTAQGKELPRGLLGPAAVPTTATPRQPPGPSPFAAQ